jgi:glycosyltransferase 2 family protein
MEIQSAAPALEAPATDVALTPQKNGLVGLLLRVGFGVLLLSFVISRVDLSEARITLDARVGWGLAGTVALLCVALVLSSVRWWLVLGSDAPPLAYLCRMYFIGGFFSLFLPTSVGGDAVRAVAVARASSRAGVAIASVVVERMLGLAAMGGILLVGALSAPGVIDPLRERVVWSWSPTWWEVIGAVAAGIGGAVLLVRLALRIPRIRAFLGDVAGLGASFLLQPRASVLALIASILVQLTYVAVWLGLALVLRLPVPAAHLLVLVPFASIIAMLPVTLAGLGLREGAWVIMLASYGVTSADALAFSLLYLVALLIVGALGGISFAVRGVAPRSATESSRTLESASQL